MRRFEFSEGTSNKFWQITLDGAAFVVQWGKIGTAGQTQTKSFASEHAAKAELDKLVAEKKKKGYVEVEVAADTVAPTAATAPAAKPRAPKAAPATSPAADATPEPADPPEPAVAVAPSPNPEPIAASDVDITPRVVFPDEERAAALVGWRRLPSPPALDTGALLTALRRIVTAKDERQGSALARWELGRPKADAAGLAVLDAIATTYAIGKAPATLDAEREAATAVLLYEDDALLVLASWWVARAGLCFALDAFTRMRGYYRHYDWTWDQPSPTWLTAIAPEDNWDSSVSRAPRDIVPVLAALVAQATPEAAAEARAHASTLREGLPLVSRFGLALVFADEAWAAADVAAILEAAPLHSGDTEGLAYLLTDGALLEAFAKKHQPHGADALVARAGLAATRTVAKLLEDDYRRDAAAAALARIESVESARALTTVLDKKSAAPIARAYFERRPDLGIVVLLPIVTGRGKLAAYAEPLLKGLLRVHPSLVASLAGHLDAKGRAWLEAERAGAVVVIAHDAALPSPLRDPPWLAPRPSNVLPILALEVLGPFVPPPWSDEGRASVLRSFEPYAGWLARERIPESVPRRSPQMDALVRKKLPEIAWYREQLVHLASDAFIEAGLADGTLPHMGASYVFARFGERMWPTCVAMLADNAQDVLSTFRELPEPRLARPVALALDKKTLRAGAIEWLERMPEVAVTGLVPLAFGAEKVPRAAAQRALRVVARRHRDVLLAVAARYGGAAEAAVQTLLALPADEYPVKLPTAPKFVDLATLSPPWLRDRQGALSPKAIAHLATVLQLSPLDAPLSILEEITKALDPESSAEFAWELFSAWLAQGAPAKDAWAFWALGHLGDDATARLLTPMIRAWPGESAHARAVVGLDVLATIGTDVALMHLHGIAQKLKFKGLQEKAREKIDAVAQARGLSAEELADRLVPDLGLDDDGTLRLDFGPRQFTVGFDEALKPFVRDAAGKRTGDLPKAGKSDDAEKAAAAIEQYKALKKDAKTIAQGQVLRLELIMCAQRRFDAAGFRNFFVAHPLMIHLVRRVLWGVYVDGTLTAGFRVAEDGTFADRDDGPFTLAEDATVGVVHRLELDDADAAAWGQVFGDYEILQPFDQLGRAVYRARPEELAGNALTRVDGVTVKTGKILGLESRGWHKGVPQDAGWVWEMVKPLSAGLRAELILDGGLAIGYMEGTPTEQKLKTVSLLRDGQWQATTDLSFAALSPVAFSELVRDLEGMRG
jgi:predicted DNA-binding WGR domain protein